MNVHYLSVLCFCLLKQELEEASFSNLQEYSIKSEQYEQICAYKLQNLSSMTNIISDKFDSCILNISRSYNHSEEIEMYDEINENIIKKEFEFSPFIIFMITLYALTIIVSILGNILLIIVMSIGIHSSFLDISVYLVNLGIFNLLM